MDAKSAPFTAEVLCPRPRLGRDHVRGVCEGRSSQSAALRADRCRVAECGRTADAGPVHDRGPSPGDRADRSPQRPGRGHRLAGGAVPDPAGQGHRPAGDSSQAGPLDGIALAGRPTPESGSFTVHQLLARINDDAERFASIDNLPDGKTHWTLDDARRRSTSMTSRRPRVLPTSIPCTSTFRPSCFTGGCTITERSFMRKAPTSLLG
ncbi:DUF6192 family protein [Streptomyces sp. NBC_00386]|uniref:DUF6192 family protein n=1 Tax=Streptomyces sp. NBC_00386 TaxID=2975734 RepID=UPI002E1F175A